MSLDISSHNLTISHWNMKKLKIQVPHYKSLLKITLIKNVKKKKNFVRLPKHYNKQGKLQLPVKIFKSKVFSTDEYLLWDSGNVFCEGIIFFQA